MSIMFMECEAMDFYVFSHFVSLFIYKVHALYFRKARPRRQLMLF